MDRYNKDPDAELDYSVDWSRYLQDETLVASTWEIAKATGGSIDGLVLGDQIFTPEGLTTIWLTVGVVGVVYTLTNHITTSLGRIDDRSIEIRVKDR